MLHTAKLFLNGRSQAVRLPASYRFEGTEVFIRRDPATGDVILSGKPTSWDGFVTAAQAAAQAAAASDDFLSHAERHSVDAERDPFADPH